MFKLKKSNKMPYLDIKKHSDFFYKCSIKYLVVERIIFENLILELGGIG